MTTKKSQRQLVAVAGAAVAVVVALLPVSFTSEVDGTTYSCGAAVSAAFHRWPGCREVAPPYLIGAVILLAVTAMVVIRMREKEQKAQLPPAE
ncbi:hypothetical protein ACF09L_32730 [Streptomyces sp. NPDC014779]|uniref:hypothetical protein n=1 Tax=Streptomyces sp. NPDC014779 TaxID=3364911 RepID=UPI003700FB63